MSEKNCELGLSLIQTEYDIGNVHSSRRLTGGLVNDLYLFETSKGKFVYKQFRSPKPSSLEKEQELLLFLERQSFPVPHVIQRKNSDSHFLPGTGYLYEYVEGYCPSEPNQVTTIQLQGAGHVLGTYHALTREYPFQQADISGKASRSGNPEGFFSQGDAKTLWNNILSMISQRASLQKIDLEIIEISRKMLQGINSFDYTGLNHLMRGLPTVFGHGDYQGTNLVFGENDAVKAVLDWENARELTRAGEVLYATVVMSKTTNTENFNTPLDLGRCRVFLEAYNQHVVLTNEEVSVMPYMAYAASLVTPFLLQTHYFDRQDRLDRFFPQHIDDWFWWQNNHRDFSEIVRQAVSIA